MKNVLAILLALIFTTSLAQAATSSNSFTNLKNAVKQDVQNAKNAVKQDVQNAKKEQQQAKANSAKERKTALKTQRDNQINTIDNQINTKKQEIKTVKNSTSMTQTEKNIKIRAYERQIEVLEARKAKIDSTYKKSIEAIK